MIPGIVASSPIRVGPATTVFDVMIKINASTASLVSFYETGVQLPGGSGLLGVPANANVPITRINQQNPQYIALDYTVAGMLIREISSVNYPIRTYAQLGIPAGVKYTPFAERCYKVTPVANSATVRLQTYSLDWRGGATTGTLINDVTFELPEAQTGSFKYEWNEATNRLFVYAATNNTATQNKLFLYDTDLNGQVTLVPVGDFPGGGLQVHDLRWSADGQDIISVARDGVDLEVRVSRYTPTETTPIWTPVIHTVLPAGSDPYLTFLRTSAVHQTGLYTQYFVAGQIRSAVFYVYGKRRDTGIWEITYTGDTGSSKVSAPISFSNRGLGLVVPLGYLTAPDSGFMCVPLDTITGGLKGGTFTKKITDFGNSTASTFYCYGSATQYT